MYYCHFCGSLSILWQCAMTSFFSLCYCASLRAIRIHLKGSQKLWKKHDVLSQLHFFAFLCLLVKSLRWKQTSSITAMFLAEDRGSLAPPLRTLGLTLGEICVFIKKVNISWLSASTLLSRDTTYLARFGNCFRYHFLRYCRQ